MHYLIQDTIFNIFLKILFKIKGLHRKNIHQLRIFIEAIFYMVKTGCQWRLLPDYYGCWRAVHKRFKKWSDQNIWTFLFESVQVNPDMEYVMIDSTIVRAHACAAGYGKNNQDQEALGKSKGGFSTKIHTLVDALGNPLKFILTPGQSSDIKQAIPLTEKIFDIPVLADKGYDADVLLQNLKKHNCSAVIPSRCNRKQPREHDKFLYQDRNRIECFFGKVKHFRKIFSRFDKKASVYLSFWHFAGALIWLR